MFHYEKIYLQHQHGFKRLKYYPQCWTAYNNRLTSNTNLVLTDLIRQLTEHKIIKIIGNSINSIKKTILENIFSI